MATEKLKKIDRALLLDFGAHLGLHSVSSQLTNTCIVIFLPLVNVVLVTLPVSGTPTLVEKKCTECFIICIDVQMVQRAGHLSALTDLTYL